VRGDAGDDPADVLPALRRGGIERQARDVSGLATTWNQSVSYMQFLMDL
jgi:hypothetical protein